MLSTYDLQMVARLEDRYLDPDYYTPGYSDEKEEAMWEEADRRYAEKCLEK